jgi:O-antigen biosynthesis protein
MLNKFKKALIYANQYGWLALLSLILASIRRARHPFAKISITDRYDELIAPPFGNTIDTELVSPMTINWFIPPVGKGLGGHLNLFRFIRNLEDLGYDNRVIIVGHPQPFSAASAKIEIEKWFSPLRASVYVGVNGDTPSAYFSMATSWPTAYYVKRFLSCVEKCYFVQDFEPWFYPSGTDALLAEDTYRFGFSGFTAGGWLAEKLSVDYGMRTYALGFSFDREIYRPMPEIRRKDGFRRVFFYARPSTARRAFELGILVLREVCKQLPDVRVVLAGWDVRGYEIPFPCEHAGLVEVDHLAELYGRCDAALVLSSTNLSLLPLELMACGVPVVSNRAPYTQWLLNDEIAILAEQNVEALAEALIQVLKTPDLAERIKQEGVDFANRTSWEQEAKNLADQLAKMVR